MRARKGGRRSTAELKVGRARMFRSHRSTLVEDFFTSDVLVEDFFAQRVEDLRASGAFQEFGFTRGPAFADVFQHTRQARGLHCALLHAAKSRAVRTCECPKMLKEHATYADRICEQRVRTSSTVTSIQDVAPHEAAPNLSQCRPSRVEEPDDGALLRSLPSRQVVSLARVWRARPRGLRGAGQSWHIPDRPGDQAGSGAPRASCAARQPTRETAGQTAAPAAHGYRVKRRIPMD